MNELEYFIKRQTIVQETNESYRTQMAEFSELLEEVKHMVDGFKATNKISIEDEGRVIREIQAGKRAIRN